MTYSVSSSTFYEDSFQTQRSGKNFTVNTHTPNADTLSLAFCYACFIMYLSHPGSLLFIYNSIYFLIAFSKTVFLKANRRTLSLNKIFRERPIYGTDNQATLVGAGQAPDVLTTHAHPPAPGSREDDERWQTPSHLADGPLRPREVCPHLTISSHMCPWVS